MRGTYSFFDRGVGVKPLVVEVNTSPPIYVDKITPVALQEVDVLDVQALQTILNRGEDVLEQRLVLSASIRKRETVTLRERPWRLT
jgi:hypothetical protein